jgi:uncharacterized cupredoxin-like copper-binding protein
MNRKISLIATLAVSLVLVACSTGQASPSSSAVAASPAAASPSPTVASPSVEAPSAGGSAAATMVDVKLQEWSINPTATSAPAGPIVFNVTNTGPADVHEFVVLKTDLDPGALPTDATGKAVEEALGIEGVDEVENLAVGKTQQLTVNLQPGNYVLVCNIYDATTKEAHYKLGMRIGLKVGG